MVAPTPRMVPTNGIRMHVVEQGEGPLVVLCHGFPELSHSWRHQIVALADAGYRVVAPDMRGYGETDRPEAIEAYDILQLTGDLVGLLDDARGRQGGLRRPRLGRDGRLEPGGAGARARAGRRGAERAAHPRGSRDPISTMEFLFADRFFYILYFQTPGVADAELAADVEGTIRRLMRGSSRKLGNATIQSASAPRPGSSQRSGSPVRSRAWLTQEDLDTYVDAFTRTGFTGGLNWYRNLRRNWEVTADVADWTVRMPALFLTGSDDPVRAFMTDAHLDELAPDLRGKVVLDGAGHWVQQERPDEVNEVLLGFLRSLD